jgi:hypothetical protein
MDLPHVEQGVEPVDLRLKKDAAERVGAHMIEKLVAVDHRANCLT